MTMKKQLLSFGIFAFTGFAASAQCISITCPGPVNVNATTGNCGATVTYATPTFSSSCSGSANDTFQYTGAVQTYVVSPGVNNVTIQTWGAQGGANWVNNVNYGGYTRGDFAVTPGETLYIFVGQQPAGITGGFNGGGNGEGAGQGGGGATDVRQNGSTYSDRIIVAGGAGGAGYWSNLHVVGGLGGGLTGGNGYRDPDFASNPGGEGGTQTSSGNGTCVSFNNPAMAGGFGYGGAPAGCGCEGYGGGGGWYGGAGSGNCRGGGGGSSYLLPTATNPNMQQGVRVGNGMAVISYSVTSVPTLTQTAGLASGAVFPVGVTTNTFTASDANGNTNSCSFQVTVTDAEAPVITAAPVSFSVPNDNGQCGAVVNWSSLSATDNCSVLFTSNYNSGDFLPIGNTTVTYVAADPSGNTDTATFVVTVTDTEIPVISSLPSSVTVNNDNGQCGAIINWTAPTVTDNCTVTTSSNHNSGDFFPIGTTPVTYIATDASGNADTATFNVTVNDAEMPVLTCPANITVNADSGMCSSSVSIGNATATDNCSIASTTNNAPAAFPVGTTTVTWTTQDVNGNTSTCTQTVTVNDNQAPNFLFCPNDITVCSGVVNYQSPMAEDNCSGVTLVRTSGPASGSTLAAGSFTVIFTATDSSGNSSTCGFTITVHATPTVGLNLSMASVVCLDDANYTLSGGTPAGGVWSGSGVSAGSFDPSSAGAGTHTITYTYTDVNGCSATATDSVTVSTCVGIDEKGNNTFSFFPNPATGSFWFNSAGNGTLELLNLNGQVVQSQQVRSAHEEINVSTLAAGVYMVKFTSEKGVSTAQLIIQQ